MRYNARLYGGGVLHRNRMSLGFRVWIKIMLTGSEVKMSKENDRYPNQAIKF